MGREIKFRAWDSREKKMFKVDVLAISECGWSCPDHGKRGVSLPYQPQTPVMQFTGMLDKKGREIYEGDIVRGDNGAICKVEFLRGAFVFISEDGFYEHMENTGTDTCDAIMGNIYETPEYFRT